MRAVRAAGRILGVVAMVVHGLGTIAFLFPRRDAAARRVLIQRWAERLLRTMGIRVRVSGQAHPGPVLLVANHVSWLDIPTLHASAPQTRFVSKSAIAHWPLVGHLARASRTLFIERERKRDALRVVHEVAAALNGADTVAVFPEGTTGAGDGVLPFHANLLQAAIVAGVAVQPVVLRYSEPGHPVSRAAQYVGPTTLVESVLRVCGARGLVVDVQFLPPEAPGELDRRVLAQTLRERIGAALAALDRAD